MLEQSFIHIKGIGKKVENLLWENNINDWNKFLKSKEIPLSKSKIELLNQKIIKSKTKLPIVIGFGIKNVRQAKEICQIADGAVIGSAIIKIIEQNLNNSKKILTQISNFIKKLKKGIE